LHIRGGYVIPTQPSGNNTEESRQNPFTLVAALDLNDFATGELFIDDGITHDWVLGKYLLYNFTVNATKIILEPKDIDGIIRTKLETESHPNTQIGEIKIFGVIDPPYPLLINLTTLDPAGSILEEYQFNSTTDVSHDLSLGVLTLQNLEKHLDLSSNSKYVFEWDYRHWNK